MSERKVKLERVDDHQIIQLHIDGFQELKLNQKIFSYYLTLASIAGRDIASDQKNRLVLESRILLEQVYEFLLTYRKNNKLSDDFEKSFKEVHKYIHMFWFGTGPFNMWTGAKYTLNLTLDQLRSLIEYCLGCDGGQSVIKSVTKETLLEYLQRISPLVLDKSWRSILTEKGPEKDWIKESAVNFYSENLTLHEVQEFVNSPENDKNPLNSSLVKGDDGIIKPLIWRAGDKSLNISEGKYHKELSNVIKYLQLAIPYAESDTQKQTVELLIKYFKSGDLEDFRKFNIHWITDHSQIDFIMGFIEVYTDPLGLRAEYESIIYWKDPKLTEVISIVGKKSQYFEDRMPWDKKYKKTDVQPLDINIVNVINGVPGGLPIGVNLPNEDQLRQKYGSKSIVIKNVTDTYTDAFENDISEEFCYDDYEKDLNSRYGGLSDLVMTSLHEVCGHSSGVVYVDDPAKCLTGYFSTLEEARADLVAWYHIFDPILIETGVIPHVDVAKQLYMAEVRNALLIQLRKVKDSDQLEEDHMKNRQLIVNYILKNSKSIERRDRDGKTYYCVVNFEEARECAGKLLAEIMRIKAEGDLPAAKSLIDTYGLYIDTKIRDQVIQRVEKLNIPPFSVLNMPTLEPVYDQNHSIQDIKVSYNQSYDQQQLSYSKSN
ncbi:hypothetical protein DLAC_00382 [Tieghemostelium lacteum]|uniref:Dipeptidyl-peptidase III n=1 Tax=Tieghemostelium lacteum TaxID=361077 RepID=A0A152A9K0_TIELA|nr:hypothetical protein DLAC_00382 [Tieghemostelium lacteum]|eukprot:KYR02902.1 hypothetical protein DLAC_00382 [Tieghemostelium lacteum]